MMIRKFLFPSNQYSTLISALILLLRVAFAGMLMTHGWAKLTNFAGTAESFAAIGGSTAAVLVIFAEFFCALGIVSGFLYRLALIPVIINMSVAFFVAHGARLIGEHNGELAFLYLVVFVVLMFTGAGKYAIDSFFVKK